MAQDRKYPAAAFQFAAGLAPALDAALDAAGQAGKVAKSHVEERLAGER